MMFLDADERILLLQQMSNPLELGSLKLIRQTGIKTVRLSPWCSWHQVEPERGCEYDWSATDRQVDRARQAGLKVAVHVYWRAPDWLWEGKIEFVYSAGTSFIGPQELIFGLSWVAVNPFNAEAMKLEAEFIESACEHFTVPGEVECNYAMPYSAERILPFGTGDYTEQMCVDVYLARQEIFSRYASGLWSAFHPYHADGRGSVDGSTLPHVGNEHTTACDEALRAAYPDHSHNRILYNYWMAGSAPTIRPHLKHWVGAEYIAGVVEHAKLCNGPGIWGMVMAHSHERYDPRQPRDAEYASIVEALEIMEAGREQMEALYR